MSLLADIGGAITDAMRKHDALRLSALRMLKAALVNREVERGHALDEAESLQVVAGLVKQRKDSIEQFTKGGRQDLADKEAAEIRVLEAYLPPAADPGRDRTRRARRRAGNRRDVAEGHGARDEGGHGEAGRAERGRQSRERTGPAHADRRRVLTFARQRLPS